jgi:chromosome segregation ATPase
LKRGDILCEVETDQGLIPFKSLYQEAVLAKILVEPKGLFHAHSSHSSHPTITSEKIKINSPVALLVADEVDYQIWILNDNIREHESKIREHESEIREHESKLRELESKLRELESKLRELESKLPELESEILDLKKKRALVEAEMESQIDQQTVYSLRIEIGGISTEIGGTKTEIGGTKTEIGGTKTEIGGTKTEIGGTKTEIASINDKIAALRNEIAGIRSEIANHTRNQKVKREQGNKLADFPR